LVIRAGCGAPVGRLAPPSTPPALFDAAILSELRSGIFSFNLSLIVRQSQAPPSWGRRAFLARNCR